MEKNLINEDIRKMMNLIGYDRGKTLTENKEQLDEAGGMIITTPGLGTFATGGAATSTALTTGAGTAGTALTTGAGTAGTALTTGAGTTGAGAAGAGGLLSSSALATAAPIAIGLAAAVYAGWVVYDTYFKDKTDAQRVAVALTGKLWPKMKQSIEDTSYKVGRNIEPELGIVDERAAKDYANKLYEAFNIWFGTDEDAIQEVMADMNSLIDLSRVAYEYGTKDGNNLLQELDDELGAGDYNRYVGNVLKNVPLAIFENKQYEDFESFSLAIAEKYVKKEEEEVTDYTEVKDKVTGGGSKYRRTAVTYNDVLEGKGTAELYDKGGVVEEIQKKLNILLKVGLKLDGAYGPKTKAEVQKFQKEMKQKVDGIFKQETAKKLDAELKKLKQPKPTPQEPKPVPQTDNQQIEVVYADAIEAPETIESQIAGLQQEIQEQPSRQQCKTLIGTAAAALKKDGTPREDLKNNLAICYNLYDFISPNSNKVRKGYGLKRGGNITK